MALQKLHHLGHHAWQINAKIDLLMTNIVDVQYMLFYKITKQ